MLLHAVILPSSSSERERGLPVSERHESHSVERSQEIGGEVDGLEVPQWRELEGLQRRDLKGAKRSGRKEGMLRQGTADG